MTDMIEITETETFRRAAARVFTEAETEALILHLAASPESGTLIPNSGGVRYLRWRAKGHGKGRGARVVYYFGGLDMPLFLLTVYFKGRKETITAADQRDFRALADKLKADYKR